MGTRLLLVRHGHSAGQLTGLVDGHSTCGGLSEQGRRQVSALGDRLVRTKEADDATLLYTSLLRRAMDTAESLAEMLPGVSDVVQDCDLCEIHEPALVGRRHEPRVEYWRRVGFWTPSSTGAESYEQFMGRAVTRLERLVAEQGAGTVVVVTHAGVIRSAIAAFAGSPLGDGFLLRMRNTSITELVHDPIEHRPFTWALLRYNDGAHLGTAEES